MATAVEVTIRTAAYLSVPIDQVAPAPGFNNRRSLGDLAELSASIRSVGLLQPLLVRKVESALDRDVVGYFIIAGHRRHAAAKLAGLSHVDVKVVDQDERERMESLLVENLQRLDIDPLEEAEGYKRLVDFGLKQQDVAGKVGRSPAHVSKRLSLLELPKDAMDLIAEKKLALVDAMELIPYLKDPEVVAETIKQAKENIRKGWGTDRLGDTARGIQRQLDQQRKRKAAHEQLAQAKVSIIKTNEYGDVAGGSYKLTQLGKGYSQLPITAAAHSKSPCHAAYVDQGGEIRYVCTKPSNHRGSDDKAVTKALRELSPARSAGGGNPSTKAQAKKAAASRERNKVLKVREPLRTAELTRLLTARQKREDVLDFTLRNLLQLLVTSDYEVAERAAAFLEIPMSKKTHTYDRANPEFAAFLSGGNDRLFKLAYAFALASGEEPFAKLMKQGYFDQEYSTNATRYLDHLQANGYRPDKVELAQLPKQENGYRWKDAFDVAKPKGKGKAE